ncbi:MAG: zf-HC2 domain-containing protein [Melioribacteraceae bacterium]
MSCEEVKILLHDFVDELLDDETKKLVYTHIQKCEKCREEYIKLTRFFDLLKDMPYQVNAPKDIIESLSNELMKKSLREIPIVTEKSKARESKLKREQLKQDRKLKTTRGPIRKSVVTRSIASSLSKEIEFEKSFQWIKLLLILLPLFLFAVGYVIYDFSLINSPWKIKTIKGSYLIDGKKDYAGLWYKNSTLTTEDNSTIVVNVPNSCRLEIYSNSSLILLKAKNNDNRVKLENGEVRISNSVLVPHFSIIIDKSKIIYKGGTLNLKAKNEVLKIFVETGICEVEEEGNKFFIDEGYLCELRKNFNIGTPYRIDASDSLKKEIEKFDYYQGGESSIERIIKLSRTEDALTLLALIPKVDAAYRAILFQKIANYFPPPSNVTYEGIIKLNNEMLNSWWREIEWQL